MTKKPLHLDIIHLEILARLSVLPLCFASALMVVQAKDSSDEYGKIGFSNISGFKFLLSTNCIAAPYALVSATLVLVRRPVHRTVSWALFVLDQLTTYLMVTSSSAATELLYLAHQGDKAVSWSEVCSYFGRLCSRAQVSLYLHFVALVCFVCISLLSAMRLFSAFEPPPPSVASEEDDGQVSNGALN